jgi:hypothetical protein
MVDGGLSYERYGAKDLDNMWIHHYYVDQVNDKTWEYYRDYATRGSRGKDGKQPLTWIPLSKMDDDYLEAVLGYGGAEWHLELIRKEIEYRKFKIHQKESITELMNMDSYSEQNVPKSGKKSSDKLKGCACYGSNSMHECNCK